MRWSFHLVQRCQTPGPQLRSEVLHGTKSSRHIWINLTGRTTRRCARRISSSGSETRSRRRESGLAEVWRAWNNLPGPHLSILELTKRWRRARAEAVRSWRQARGPLAAGPGSHQGGEPDKLRPRTDTAGTCNHLVPNDERVWRRVSKPRCN